MLRKTTSKALLTSVCKHLRFCEKYRDGKRLETYIQSTAFTQSLAALNATDKLRAVDALTDARNACRQKLAQEKPLPKAGSVRIKWKGNDELIAKAIRLAALYHDDESYARALGVPYHAARVARHRYAGRKSAGAAATQQHQR